MQFLIPVAVGLVVGNVLMRGAMALGFPSFRDCWNAARKQK